MKTKLNIKDELYFHARKIAEAEGIAVEKVVSRMMRDSFHLGHNAPDDTGYIYNNGIPIIAGEKHNQREVSQELIDRIRLEEEI